MCALLVRMVLCCSVCHKNVSWPLPSSLVALSTTTTATMKTCTLQGCHDSMGKCWKTAQEKPSRPKSSLVADVRIDELSKAMREGSG